MTIYDILKDTSYKAEQFSSEAMFIKTWFAYEVFER